MEAEVVLPNWLNLREWSFSQIKRPRFSESGIFVKDFGDRSTNLGKRQRQKIRGTTEWEGKNVFKG